MSARSSFQLVGKSGDFQIVPFRRACLLTWVSEAIRSIDYEAGQYA